MEPHYPVQDEFGNQVAFPVATPYVHDAYRHFNPPVRPTPQHYLPFPTPSATAPHPGAQYDAAGDYARFGHNQYSYFAPHVRQHPSASTVEQAAVLRPMNYLDRANPKPGGPAVDFTQAAIDTIIDRRHAPIVGTSNTYRCPNPIPVPRHAAPAVSSDKAPKKHRRGCDVNADAVTAEDHALLARTPKEWQFFLENSNTSRLRTVAHYKAVWKKLCAKRCEDEYQAQQKAWAQERGDSQAHIMTSKELHKTHKEKRQTEELLQAMSLAGTQRSTKAIDRFGQFGK